MKYDIYAIVAGKGMEKVGEFTANSVGLVAKLCRASSTAGRRLTFCVAR